MTLLTPRQSEILDYIRASIADRGMAPTRPEMQAAFGFTSTNAAQDHLRALARKGFIKIEPRVVRGIQVLA